MSLRMDIRPEAIRDLQDAREWYERQQTGLGDTFARRAAAAIDGIQHFPELFGLVWKDVRAAPIKRHPYIVYYRLLSDRIEVIAVFHARRDDSEWKNRV